MDHCFVLMGVIVLPLTFSGSTMNFLMSSCALKWALLISLLFYLRAVEPRNNCYVVDHTTLPHCFNCSLSNCSDCVTDIAHHYQSNASLLNADSGDLRIISTCEQSQ